MCSNKQEYERAASAPTTDETEHSMTFSQPVRHAGIERHPEKQGKQSLFGVNVLVMDSCRCWTVCAANFVILFFGAAFGRALSMNFLDFVTVFDATITITSIGFTLHLLAISFSSMLVMNLIVPHTGERVACVIGTICNALCTIGISLSPNLGIFIFFMGLKGFCVGTSFVPAIVMISQYFHKRRSLATALANCGLSVGSIATPPIVELFMETYGLRGTYIIIAALEMNSIAAAMLLRPIRRYKTVIRDLDEFNLTTINGDKTAMGCQMTEMGQQMTSLDNEKAGEGNHMTVSNGNGSWSASDDNAALPAAVNCHDRRVGITENKRASDCGDNSDGSPLMPRLNTDHILPYKNAESSVSSINSSYYDEDGSVIVCGSAEADSDNAGFLVVNDHGPRMRSISETDDAARNLRHSKTHMDWQKRFSVVNQLSVGTILEDGRRQSASTDHQYLLTPTGCPIDAIENKRKMRPEVKIFISHEDSIDCSWNTSQFDDKADYSNGVRPSLPDTSSHVCHPRPRYRSDAAKDFLHQSDYYNKGLTANGRKKSNRSNSLKSSTWSMVSAPISDIAVDVEVCALASENRTIEENEAEDKDTPTNASKSKKFQNVCLKFLMVLHTVFNVKLLRTWSLRILLMSSLTGTLVQYLATYLPTIAVKQGIGPEQVSVLLTIAGAVDLGSRIGTGAFTDLSILKPTQIVAIAGITIGTVCHFTRFYTTFEMLVFLSVVIGLFGGTRQSLSTLLTIEFMGVERFLKALGFQAMFGTLSLAIHHPLLSSIMESTSSFAPPLHYVGVALYISSALLLMEPLAKRLDKKKCISYK